MCAICGKVHFDRRSPVDQESVAHMMAAMHHRGPDGEGHYLSGAVGLGHVRLSIIDLEYGARPIAHEDEPVWIVFSGALYNSWMRRKNRVWPAWNPAKQADA